MSAAQDALREVVIEARRLNAAAGHAVFNPAVLDLVCGAIIVDDPDADAFRQGASNEWGSDDIEIDGDAIVSRSETGAFVAAWVWVSNEEAGIEETDDEESEA